jgi:hypothetical protein
MSFDFSGDAWETSTDQLLPVGSFVVTITEADPGHTKGSMGRDPKPQIEIKVENDQGSRRDWIVITEKTVGKVAQLFDAAGVERPQEGEFNSQTGELTEACVARLRNRKVGVVIRNEDSLKNPGQQEPRIAGYVEAARITDDMPADTRGVAASASRPATDDDKVPFFWEEPVLDFEAWHGHANR